MKIFLLFLTTIGFLNASGATADETTELAKLTKIVSPERLLTPERGYIANEYFAFVYIRPDFVDSIAPIFADQEIMKYLGDGKTYTTPEVRGHTERKVKNQERHGYYWAIISHEGVCGIASVFSIEGSSRLGIARVLSSNMKGCKQGRALFETIFNYLPDTSWEVTSDPRNIASWKSQESSGFIYQKTEYVEDYQGDRKFYARPSNTELEGSEKFSFSYSGKVCSFAELMS
jgi:RimJ/RimL family protein N-acetyltransferase